MDEGTDSDIIKVPPFLLKHYPLCSSQSSIHLSLPGDTVSLWCDLNLNVPSLIGLLSSAGCVEISFHYLAVQVFCLGD